ncbi:ATP-binding protein [Sphingomonas psychrotolerans]|uniref:ATP-binding protein n=1 Tax=Sphingomonas psychrotolerans TaxID=1327635 RepID=A0A2K8MCD3_9SPHN|nr:ATP-binding protein [Sphingomonas psychrotolerans]ATY30624.1 ATP-binding protein [Sphingomonas psychrotolerans]
MSWSERLQHWLRGLLGGDAGNRRIPERLDYVAPVEEAALVPISTGRASMAQPSIAFRRNAVFAAFNTAVPVSDRHGLAGRKKELARLIDAVVKQRKHALVYGARGSGKTSLARVFGDLADEAGCVALYGSASEGTDIDGLFRPFLDELPLQRGIGGTIPADRAMGVQQIANLFVQGVTQRTLLIVDEFDRVTTERTRHEVASLLKLLTDMHSAVQIVLVGIAGNVDGLLAAHPSLRRHLFAQPVAPIERDELAGLLRLCAQQAGLAFEEDALQTIVSAAIGSPYHARVFGMHAALSAEAAGRERIALADAQKGLAEALAEWSDLTPEICAVFERALGQAGSLRGMIALAGVLAAHAPVLTFERMTAAGVDLFGDELGGPAAVDRTIGLIAPALSEDGMPGELQFADSLSPQFLVLMANGAALRSRDAAPVARDTLDARELLQGVGL